MALPSDLYGVAVTGSFRDASGQALAGTVTFTPGTTLTDSAGNVVIPAYAKPYQLTGGALSTAPLAANDNADLLPVNSTYTVRVELANLQPYSYSVQLLAAPFTFTATLATPAVFTATGSAYVNGTAVQLTGASVPAGFTAGTTYYVVSASGTAFSLAATSGGSAIASTGTGSGTVSTASVDIADLQPVVSQGTPVSYVPTSGGTYTGTVVFDGSPALQIPSGAASGQVLTSDSSGNAVWAAPALVVKPSVQEATAAALPANAYVSGVLTASSNGALTVDGIAVPVADRILVKNEVAAANNGIYTCTAAGSAGTKYVLTRAADFNVAADVPGAFVFAEQGTTNGQTGWMVTGAGPFTIGSTAIPWTQFSATPSAGLLTPTAVKTANYTAVAGDMVKTDTSGGSLTVTLPTAPAVNTTIGVKQVTVAGLGTNATTVAAGGSDVFNKSGGPASFTLDRLNQTVVLQYGSGAIWTVISTDPATGQIATARDGIYYLDTFTGTDDQKMTAALAAVFAASPAGGTIVLSPRAHTFAGQWATSYSAGVVTALKIQGAGVAFDGAWGTPSAATTCDMQYASTGAARIDMQHIGTIEITGIMFRDTVASTVPFFQTTNATPNLHDNVWAGNSSVSGLACYQDAIILGGTSNSAGSGDTAEYQGYQGAVYRNFFHRIRRTAFFRSAANAIQVYGNTVSITCGSNLYLGACIEIQGNSGNNCTGNQVFSNCIEGANYPVPVKCTAYAVANTLGPNGIFDAGASTYACYWFDDAGTAKSNEVIDGYHPGTVPFAYDPANANTFRSQAGTGSYYPAQANFRGQAFFAGQGGQGPVAVDSSGNQGYWQSGSGVSQAFPSMTVKVAPGTQVTDGSTIAGSNVVTSLTAAWASTDAGCNIGGSGINSNTFIAWTYTPSTALPWQASTAYAAGQITRPVSPNSHLYQCSTAGTSGSSAPAFPTGGGTVTDGTAVWTDLGTAATAAVITKNATATATGVTLGFGRAGTAVTMTSFASHHIVPSGSTPTGTAFSSTAGTGSTITLAGADLAHQVTLNTGTSPAAGQLLSVTFALPFAARPLGIAVTPFSASAAALLAGGYYLSANTTSWGLFTIAAPPASTSGLVFLVTVI